MTTGPGATTGRAAASGGAVGEPTPALSVVLPAHNEVALLGATVTALRNALDDRQWSAEVVIVENGSSDGTLRLARTLAGQLEDVRLVSLANGDYGAALAAGLAAARGSVVACFDVDYFDLDFLDAALSAVEGGADLVLASKRAPGARDRRPLLRRCLTGGFAAMARLLVGLGASDAHGMKVLVADRLGPVVQVTASRGSLFDVEMVARASRAGLHIVELPATVEERRPPRSPVGRRAVESFVGLVQLRRRLGRGAGRVGRPSATGQGG